jgi:hypothetical protein
MNEDLIPEYGQPTKFKRGNQVYYITEKRIDHSQLLHKTIVMYRIIARGFNRWVEADRLVSVK